MAQCSLMFEGSISAFIAASVPSVIRDWKVLMLRNIKEGIFRRNRERLPRNLDLYFPPLKLVKALFQKALTSFFDVVLPFCLYFFLYFFRSIYSFTFILIL